MSRSLTYSELAKALEITPESANRLARRKHWPRVKGNDGRTRVAVPEDFCPPDSPGEGLNSPGDGPPVSPGDKPPDSPDNPVHAQIARLESELAGMREALAEARARAAPQRQAPKPPRLGRTPKPLRLRRRSAPSRAWPSGSKRRRPSAPSSRGGSGFSGGPDEASQHSGSTGGG